MELLPISDQKIKIMLTKDDLASVQLTSDSIDYDTTETRKAFWTILDEAKKKTGFDAAKEKVYVEIYPVKNGGCEMYVTKLMQKNEDTSVKLVCKESAPLEKTLYAFHTLEDMLSACARLFECGFHAESVAYAELHTYYLVIGSTQPSHKQKRDSISLLDLVAEYGEKVAIGKESLLCEHGTCICPDHAVERYATLAASGYRR